MKRYNIPILGKVPRDKEIIKMELQGIPIIEIHSELNSYLAMRNIAKQLIGILFHGNNPLNS